MIRHAIEADLPAIVAIYERIHDSAEAGRITTGWLRGVYPTIETARATLDTRELFVLEDGGIVAAARINRTQVDVYAQVDWRYPATDEQVMVLHTLTVDPARSGLGYGRQFLAFYEAYALAHGCLALRIDTNARNSNARRLYKKLGYREIDIVPTVFNGIPGVNLVCLEKAVEA